MAWSAVGNLKGPPGSVWRNGSGAPSNGTGANGDYYIDVATGDIYQRASGTYSVVGNIKGPAGADGTSVNIVGHVATASALPTGLGPGDAGDGYLTDDDGHLHVWSGSAFIDVGSIKGPAGDDGDPGAAGADGNKIRTGSGAPSNGTGIDGDVYIRTSNYDLYQRASGTYSVIGNIAGATGATGSNGTNGADGAVWRNGTGVPSNSSGINGDYYLDNATGDVYTKAAGAYTNVANIKGAAGARGTKWFHGSGAPSSVTGSAVGDYYIDDDTGTYYLLS